MADFGADNLEAFRTEVRTWLEANYPAELRDPKTEIDEEAVWGGRRYAASKDPLRIWQARMGEKGWTTRTWPKEYGGGGLSAAEARVPQQVLNKGGPTSGRFLAGYVVCLHKPIAAELLLGAIERTTAPAVASVMLRFHILVWLAAGMFVSTLAAAEPVSRAVLVIDQSDPSGGAPTTFSSTLRASLNGFTPHVAVYSETLDVGFAGTRQDDILHNYLQEKYRDTLQIVGVSEDEGPPEEIKRFAAAHKINYPIVMSTPELRKIFPEVMALPTTYVLDRDGNLTQKNVGMLKAKETEAGTRLLAGLKVDAEVVKVEANEKAVGLENAAQAREIPGVDLTKLSGDQRTSVLMALNEEACKCGCGLTVAKCRIDDPNCQFSLPQARTIVQKLASAKP